MPSRRSSHRSSPHSRDRTRTAARPGPGVSGLKGATPPSARTAPDTMPPPIRSACADPHARDEKMTAPQPTRRGLAGTSRSHGPERHTPPARRPHGLPATDPPRTSVVDAIASQVLRHPVAVLTLTCLAVFLALATALSGTQRLTHAGTATVDSESVRAEYLLSSAFRAGSPTVTLVATTTESVDSIEADLAGTRLTQRARQFDKVVAVDSYWPRHPPALRGSNGRTTLIHLRLTTTEDTLREDLQPVLDALTGHHGPLDVQAAGPVAVGLAIEDQSRADLMRTELLAAPVTAAVLVLVFAGFVPAALALLTGCSTVAAGTALLVVLARFTPVHVIALNLTAALGFALAVDFSLIIITRYREELTADGPDHRYRALLITWRTAGRTVVCSALTVIAGLAALLVFPLAMLRSIAYGGICAVAIGMALSLLALPAALLLLGRRITQRPGRSTATSNAWYRLAHRVMNRPLPVALILGALLGALVLPLASAKFGAFDDRALPSTAPVHQATAALRQDFDRAALNPVQVVLPTVRLPRDTSALDAYARGLSSLPHVDRVETATGSYRRGARVQAPPSGSPYASPAGVWARLITDVGPETSEGADVVRAVRATPSPVPVLVGGAQAWLADLQDAIREHLITALILIAITTLALIGWYTRSIALPVKALLTNALSLGATLGVMVLIFQEGHLRSWLGIGEVTGVTDTIAPVLILCVAFGLSMDYEVLLLARTVEEHAHGVPTREAVARGIQHTARLFTASALIVIVVMSALTASRLVVLKAVGISIAVAVFIDATIVRLLLVPALMVLLGRFNWWFPFRRSIKGTGEAPPEESRDRHLGTGTG
ncbi:MMPL family transporter [Streptomyces sp. NPDC059564]|uniref:MMPL family transporter n=1 Tax=Streptomyces sp. NPDC059564 TaxID=3346865 RepID=UPI003697E8EA